MKQPKKFTREQKSCALAHGLNPHEWALAEETEFSYRIIHKEKGTTKLIDKFRRFNGYGKK